MPQSKPPKFTPKPTPPIEDLLAGKKIDMPTAQDIRSFKQAPKAKTKKAEGAGLF